LVMTGVLTRMAAKLVATASAVLGVAAGLLFVVVRAEFRRRGCHEMPKADWAFTADCVDAGSVLRITGTLLAACALATGLALWRLRHV
jgi:hypothetical protein